MPGPPADVDLDVDNDDLTDWLSEAATHNGFATSYRRGDTEWDRDVDLTDFLNLATNFAAAGYVPQINAAVPEPSAVSLALLAICGTQLCLKRRN